jgi:hypothetical protein
MKTYEQVAQAMYEAYEREDFKKNKCLFKWEDETHSIQQNWIAAAKEAAKQFGVLCLDDYKGDGNLDDLRIERRMEDMAKDIRVDMDNVSTFVRVTHLPTGIVVECDDYESNFRNRWKAIETLALRLRDLMKTPEVN